MGELRMPSTGPRSPAGRARRAAGRPARAGVRARPHHRRHDRDRPVRPRAARQPARRANCSTGCATPTAPRASCPSRIATPSSRSSARWRSPAPATATTTRRRGSSWCATPPARRWRARRSSRCSAAAAARRSSSTHLVSLHRQPDVAEVSTGSLNASTASRGAKRASSPPRSRPADRRSREPPRAVAQHAKTYLKKGVPQARAQLRAARGAGGDRAAAALSGRRAPHQTSPARQSATRSPVRASSGDAGVSRIMIESSSSGVRTRPRGPSTQVAPCQRTQPRRA